MKKLLLLLSLAQLTLSSLAQAPSSFTITNNSGSTSLTCLTPSLSFSANSAVVPPIYFVWTGPSTSLTGPNVTITLPGNYTVTIADSTNTVFDTQYLSVTTNTTPPNSSVSPPSQTIACNTALGSGVSSNFPGSATHTFVSPYGASVIATGTVAYAPLGPGTYTHILTDNSNGCTSSSTFAIVSSQNFPTFSVVSPQNYTLGCRTKSVVTVNIINATTSPPGGPVSYTFMPLSETNPAPSGSLSSLSSYTVATPGTYYVIVKDNTSFCVTQIPVTILQNTVSPNVTVTTPTTVLNCSLNQLILQGSSTSTNVSLNWNSANGAVYGPTITASANANVTQTIANTYTFVVTDNNNTCTSNSVIPVYQNLFPPIASISAGGMYTLSCTTPTIVLSNVSYSGIPPSTGFPVNQPVVGLSWFAPSQNSLAVSTTYTASTSGTYTMIAKDLNNDCTAQTTAVIFGDCNLVGLTKNTVSQLSIHLFPNPAHDVVTLLTEGIESAGTFEVFNALGEVVLKQELSLYKTEIQIGSLSRGVYTLLITQKNGFKQTTKFIKD
ncbi:hypothetical protein CNR22_22315 [Sphingobacteriaceae bacterium]|nr:hypothetical protein CNR22_22315 [Sphingobacteriaceae bacterium]